MATDALGRFYFSNGAFSSGAPHVFNADLTPRGSVSFPSSNQGGPAIGANRTLVLADAGTDLRAYRNPPSCPGDLNGDTVVGLAEMAAILSLCGTACP